MSSNDYEVLKEIGSGSYSRVYEVKCKKTKAHFAMKKIDLGKLSNKEKEYNKTEVQILKEITHPNIIKLEKSFEEANTLYIIMELAKGGDLQSKINAMKKNNEKFKVSTIWKYAFQIISGLNILHSNNIVHRDVKASNIFIINENVLKIADFNIGKVIEKDILNTQIGTPAMMSPEIWKGEPYNSKADIWSLGCVVYQLATLKHPFIATTFPALYSKITNAQFKKVKNYPAALTHFIESLLQIDPNLRPSCEDLLKLKCFASYKSKSLCENLKRMSYFSDCINQKPKKSWFSNKRVRKIDVISNNYMNELMKKIDGNEKEILLQSYMKERHDSSLKRVKLSPCDEYGLRVKSSNDGKCVPEVKRNRSLRIFKPPKITSLKQDIKFRKVNQSRIRDSKISSKKLSPRYQEESVPRQISKIRVSSGKIFKLISSPKPVKQALGLFRVKTPH